jgi:DNA-directed RNA polymerase specialized sigma24 family protein
MFPVREEDSEDREYHRNLGTVRERILGYVLRRLVPHHADFGQAEEIAQSCVVALWEQYPDKRELAEMVRISIGAARHKIAQFHRDRGRMADLSGAAGGRREYHDAHNPNGWWSALPRAKTRTGCWPRCSSCRRAAANCCG